MVLRGRFIRFAFVLLLLVLRPIQGLAQDKSPKVEDKPRATEDPASEPAEEAVKPRSPGPESVSEVALRDTVVVVGRRESLLMKTPGAISVLSREDIGASGITNTLDLQYRVPGLVTTTNAVFGQPTIRGVGSDLISAGADNSIGTYVDGVYISRSVGALRDLYDIERIEVLKGPQGTLFGRNTTGGAIHVLTRDPVDEYEAEGSLLYGNYNRLRLRGMVNMPLHKRAQLRVSAVHDQQEGFAKNVLNDKDIEDRHRQAVRAKLRIEARDDMELIITGALANDRSLRGTGSHVEPPLSSNLGVQLGGRVPANHRKVFFDRHPRVNIQERVGSLRVNWDHGDVTTTSITAFRETVFNLKLDLDATDAAALSNEPRERSRTYTQEFRVRSSDDNDSPFEWVLGAFFLREDALQQLSVRVFPGILDQPRGELTADAAALYGQGSYTYDDLFRLTVGARGSYEEREQDYRETINGAVIARFDERDRWSALTPKVGLDVFLSPEWLIYAQVSRGFKSGGFNSTAAQRESFDPEFLWSYELGSKAELFDKRLFVQASAFFYDYTDIQLQVLSPSSAIPFPLVRNAGRAHIYGVELQTRAEIFEGFSSELNIAAMDSRFDRLVAINPNDSNDNPDQSGNQLPRAPRFSLFAALQYKFPISKKGTLTLRGEYRFQSRVYLDIFENEGVRQRSYGLVNAGLQYDSNDGHWSFSVLARNIGDQLYSQNIIRLDGTIGNLHFYGEPRTLTAQLTLRY